jgi:hypothetical protein
VFQIDEETPGEENKTPDGYDPQTLEDEYMSSSDEEKDPA